VAAWGSNAKGQCAIPAGLSGVKAIAAGYYHTLALKEDEKLETKSKGDGILKKVVIKPKR
jgi:alpha-tubulin suppressor-like RCC1 family protein